MLKLNHRTQAGAAVLFCAMSLMVGFSRTSGGYGRAPSTDFEEKLSARPTNALSALLDDLHGLTETAELPVKKGDSLASLLSSKGVDYAQILDIAKGLEDTMNPNGLRPDSDMLFVKYRPRAGSSPEVLLLEIERSPVYKVIVSASENGWVSREVHIEHQTRLVRRSGRITKGASLIETASQAGIPYNIVDKFYDVFSFDIDFERDIYPGDDFSVMYRERYGPDGRYLGNGELVFASIYLNSRRAELKLYMFEDERGRISYYDEEGRSAVKTLKKT
ncbi:MAG: hypothetical protein LBH41_02870, partial [Rickettsiales bacterium]|nr:hypothetical protein [Rickettsiales bacterium]